MLVKVLFCNLGLSLLFYGRLQGQALENEIYVGVMRGNHHLDWSIAGNEFGSEPNILSELVWEKLIYNGFSLGIRKKVKSFLLEFQYSNYSIVKGFGKDSDYLEDDKSEPYMIADFLSNNGVIKSHIFSVSRSVQLLEATYMCYGLGFDYKGEKLYISSYSDEADELNSTYCTDWTGATNNLGIEYSLGKISTELEYLFGLYRYRAKANWNLISDFQHPISFRHYATGFKNELRTTVSYRIFPKVAFGVSLNKYWLCSSKGSDLLYKQNGTIQKTQFNAVHADTFSIGSVLSYRF